MGLVCSETTSCIPTGGSRGGVAGVATPPLIFKKIVVIRVAVGLPVVIYLVVTSSNNVRLCVCVCALNGVVIGYYTIGTAIFHYYFFSLAGPRDKPF